MCTLSWIYHPSGYDIFFNRDEKRTRLPATPPVLLSNGRVAYISPADGDSGGTWLAVNQHGLTLCLLNGANLTGSAPVDGIATRSRGLLIPRFISCESTRAVFEEIRAGGLSAFEFAAFTLAAFEPSGPAAFFEWDGNETTTDFDASPHGMLTSSSFDTAAVRASRQQQWDQFLREAPLHPTRLPNFHSSHLPERSAYSTCMHRPDAETVSYSHIRVSHQAIDFTYSPGAPCLGLEGSRVRLQQQLRPLAD